MVSPPREGAVVYSVYVAGLKSDSHAGEGFCRIKLFPSVVRKNNNICFLGVLKEKWMDFVNVDFVVLKNALIYTFSY